MTRSLQEGAGGGGGESPPAHHSETGEITHRATVGESGVSLRGDAAARAADNVVTGENNVGRGGVEHAIEREGSPELGEGAARYSEKEKEKEKGGLGWKRGRLPVLVVCVALQIFQQICGVNVVVYYTPQIFKKAGVQSFTFIGDQDLTIMACTALSYLPKIPAVFVAMRLMDRAGRRRLLLALVPVMGFSLVLLVLTLLLLDEGSTLFTACAVGSIMLYGTSFVLSLGPIPSILSSEILPTHLRSKGMAVGSLSMWGFNWLVSLAFPSLQAALSLSGVLLLMAANCVIAWLFVFAFVPETKCQNLEDASSTMSRSRPAWFGGASGRGRDAEVPSSDDLRTALLPHAASSSCATKDT